MSYQIGDIIEYNEQSRVRNCTLSSGIGMIIKIYKLDNTFFNTSFSLYFLIKVIKLNIGRIDYNVHYLYDNEIISKINK